MPSVDALLDFRGNTQVDVPGTVNTPGQGANNPGYDVGQECIILLLEQLPDQHEIVVGRERRIALERFQQRNRFPGSFEQGFVTGRALLFFIQPAGEFLESVPAV